MQKGVQDGVIRSNSHSIVFIGNPASISWLLARELRARGYEVDLIAKYSKFTSQMERKPEPSLIHRAIRKYSKPLYRSTINKKEYDIELRSFSKPIVKAKNRAVIYHG